MKKLLFLLLCITAFQLTAKNKITYLKMERTPCFGKCPSYSVEFWSNGKVIYNGKKNTDMPGIHNAKMTKTQMANFFRKFEKYSYSKLASKYPKKNTDMPGMNIEAVVNGKRKKVLHAESGPAFLRQIAADIDEKVKELEWDGMENVVANEPVEGTPEIYEFVEQPAQFPGGEMTMMEFLRKNINYPSIARDNNIQGKVVCRFVVDEKGNILNPEVVRGIGYGCDDEAIRVLKLMPAWKPGMQNGKAVKTFYTLPVFFKLL